VKVRDRADIGPHSEQDGGGYEAIFPELPGCMSDG
jgi:predicted RNase H-like HicB family nuclease